MRPKVTKFHIVPSDSGGKVESSREAQAHAHVSPLSHTHRHRLYIRPSLPHKTWLQETQCGDYFERLLVISLGYLSTYAIIECHIQCYVQIIPRIDALFRWFYKQTIETFCLFIKALFLLMPILYLCRDNGMFLTP